MGTGKSVAAGEGTDGGDFRLTGKAGFFLFFFKLEAGVGTGKSVAAGEGTDGGDFWLTGKACFFLFFFQVGGRRGYRQVGGRW